METEETEQFVEHQSICSEPLNLDGCKCRRVAGSISNVLNSISNPQELYWGNLKVEMLEIGGRIHPKRIIEWKTILEKKKLAFTSTV